jgi:hypothetical protein
MNAPVTGGWWRRNRWGLVALLPALLVALALQLDDVYDIYWKRQPRQPVSAGADGWVTYGEARLKLVALEPADDLRTFGGEPFPLPAGVAAWKATIAFEATKEAIGGCKLSLEDDAGRTYAPSPDELSDARTPFASCLPDYDPPPKSYQNEIYFATPESARPVAVRISLFPQLPRYARLAPAG